MPKRISHLLAILLIVLSLGLTITAQTIPTADCPTIEVNGPVGIIGRWEPFKFAVNVKGKVRGEIKYRWVVSKGQIIEGQGTPEITVVEPDGADSLTASVELLGLPEGCARTASETTPSDETVQPILIDELELPITTISEKTLRAAADEQKQNPNNKLYLVAYTDKNISQFEVRQGIRRVSDFLIKEMKLTADDFQIEAVRSETNSVKIYRLPPGADKPTP
jgi:hypothetical protein